MKRKEKLKNNSIFSISEPIFPTGGQPQNKQISVPTITTYNRTWGPFQGDDPYTVVTQDPIPLAKGTWLGLGNI